MTTTTGHLYTIREGHAGQLANDPEVQIHAVFLSDPESNGHRILRVHGYAVGTGTVDLQIELNSNDLAHGQSAVDSASLAWDLEIGLGVVPFGGMLSLRAVDAADQVSDTVILPVPQSHTPVPGGTVANIPSETLHYSAGSSDRIVPLHSFALIEFPSIDLIDVISKYDEKQIVRVLELWDVDSNIRQVVDVEKARAAFEEAGIALRDRFRDENPNAMAAFEIKRNKFAETLRSVAKPEHFDAGDKRLLAARQGEPFTSLQQGKLALALPQNSPAKRAYSQFMYGTTTASIHTGILLALGNIPSRVGIMFDDRIRFRPAGVVRGEWIFALGLDSDEEVTISQTSETLRETNLEEITDREKELSVQASSSWTTDASMGFNEGRSSSESWDVGGNVGVAGIPKVPVSAGVNGGYNASSAAENSSSFAISSAFEQSNQAVSRMRSQHKIRMEVHDQTTVGYSSVRQLNNKGNVRPRRVEFRKLYRKEMATLERHNSRMCLKLVVNDPARTVRQQFLSNLATIDPNNEDLYPAELPGDISEAIEQKFTRTLQLTQPPVIFPFAMHTLQSFDVNIKTEGNESVPGNYVLAAQPQVRMLEMKNFRKQNYLSEGTYETFTEDDETNVTINPGISVFGRYRTHHGNDLYWLPPWILQNPNGKSKLYVHYENVFGPITGVFLKTSSIKLEFISWWLPSNIDLDNYNNERKLRREELEANLTVEKLYHLRDIAMQDYLGEVLSLSIRQNLTLGQDQEINPHQFREWFAIEDAFVENAPYWSTDSGVYHYELLRQRIQNLPLPIASSDILIPELTSAQSVLYLPIRHGAEEQALALLPELSQSNISNMVDDFRDHHRQHFGLTAYASQLPSFEEIAGSEPPAATPLGEQNWKSPWEHPQRRFSVLAQWSDFVPTDGVDCETALGISSAADEAQLKALHQQANRSGY